MGNKHDIHVFVEKGGLGFYDANGTQDRSTISVIRGDKVKWVMHDIFGTLQVTWKVDSPFDVPVSSVGPNGASPFYTVTKEPGNYDYTATVTAPAHETIIQDPRISIDPNSGSNLFVKTLLVVGVTLIAVFAIKNALSEKERKNNLAINQASARQ